MSTKDCCLPLKDKQHTFGGGSSFSSDAQYNHLNLNEKNKSFSGANYKQSQNFSTSLSDFSKSLNGLDNSCNEHLQTRNKSPHIWDKRDKSFLPLEHLNLNEKKDLKQDKFSNSTKANNGSSTFSLHIAAYEADADINQGVKEVSKQNKSWKDVKQFLVGSTSKSEMDWFEIPRQQEDAGNSRGPEIMNFRASQRLLDPNASPNNGVQQQPSPHIRIPGPPQNLVPEQQQSAPLPPSSLRYQIPSSNYISSSSFFSQHPPHIQYRNVAR
uniref:Uncharacterized protein n=1 Tax=Panagrolaimus sp. PS1159 TaxID=55785 RepID=A0AC35GMG0_9BILA